MTKNREEAEDALQDTFVSAWKAIGSYRPETGFRPWLVTILLNRIRSWRRRLMRRASKLSMVSLDTPGSEPSYEDQTGDPVETASLLSAIRKLGMQSRGVVVLRYYAELSVPEIARALDCPEGTVKSRLHRSLNTIRLHMAASERLALVRARAQSQAER